MNTAKKAAIVLAVAGVAVGATAGTASATGGSGKNDSGTNGAHAKAIAAKSPGVISGNIVQIPVSVPIQLNGNSLNLIGVLNPAFGNTGIVQ